jgi:anti-anti-sigma factor
MTVVDVTRLGERVRGTAIGSTSVATQTISVTLDDNRANVALPGEHEAYSADKLARSLAGLIDECVPVVVDLRQATFIDSTVVGVLIVASRRAREAGLRFEVLLGEETGWPVRRLLAVTGLSSEIDVRG